MSNTERAARARLVALRLFSAVLAVGVVVGVWAAGGPIGLVSVGLLAAVLTIVGPGAPIVSLLVVWTGYRISSCPNCPEVGVERVGIQHARCAVCGDEEYQIGSTMNGWIHHTGPDEWTCSWDCSSEFRAEGDDA